MSTDQDKRDAEKLAMDKRPPTGRVPRNNDRNCIVLGYLAACDLKNKRIAELEKLLSDVYDAQNG